MTAPEKARKLIERLETLEKAATPGPWGINKYGGIGTGKHFIFGGIVIGASGFDEEAVSNALEFVAASRNSLPSLLAVAKAALTVQAYPRHGGDCDANFTKRGGKRHACNCGKAEADAAISELATILEDPKDASSGE